MSCRLPSRPATSTPTTFKAFAALANDGRHGGASVYASLSGTDAVKVAAAPSLMVSRHLETLQALFGNSPALLRHCLAPGIAEILVSNANKTFDEARGATGFVEKLHSAVKLSLIHI